MPKVFVPNDGPHDFSSALQYGDIIYLTTGRASRYNVGLLYRQLSAELRSAEREDHLLITSMGVLNAIAAAILVLKFKELNLLIYNPEKRVYYKRHLVFSD